MVEIIGDLLLSPDAGLLDSWKLRGNQHLLVALGWQLKKKTIFQPPKKGRVYVALTKSNSVTLSQLSCQSHEKTYKNIGSVTISRSDLWEVATMTTRPGKHSHSYGKWP